MAHVRQPYSGVMGVGEKMRTGIQFVPVLSDGLACYDDGKGITISRLHWAKLSKLARYALIAHELRHAIQWVALILIPLNWLAFTSFLGLFLFNPICAGVGIIFSLRMIAIGFLATNDESGEWADKDADSFAEFLFGREALRQLKKSAGYLV